jgi:hypothetical protein
VSKTKLKDAPRIKQFETRPLGGFFFGLFLVNKKVLRGTEIMSTKLWTFWYLVNLELFVYKFVDIGSCLSTKMWTLPWFRAFTVALGGFV